MTDDDAQELLKAATDAAIKQLEEKGSLPPVAMLHLKDQPLPHFMPIGEYMRTGRGKAQLNDAFKALATTVPDLLAYCFAVESLTLAAHADEDKELVEQLMKGTLNLRELYDAKDPRIAEALMISLSTRDGHELMDLVKFSRDADGKPTGIEVQHIPKEALQANKGEGRFSHMF